MTISLPTKEWYIHILEDKHDYWKVVAHRVFFNKDPAMSGRFQGFFEANAEGKSKEEAIRRLIRKINKQEYRTITPKILRKSYGNNPKEYTGYFTECL